MAQMNLSMKQSHKHREQTGGCQGKEGCWRDRVGILGLADENFYIENG